MAEIFFWPESLGCPQVSGYNESSPNDGLIRTTMQSGPQKVRKRVSSVTTTVDFNLILRGAGVQTLENFYWITLNQVRSFYWPDYKKPMWDDNVGVYRFLSPPVIQAMGGDIFQATLQVERMAFVNGHFLLNIRETDNYLST